MGVGRYGNAVRAERLPAFAGTEIPPHRTLTFPRSRPLNRFRKKFVTFPGYTGTHPTNSATGLRFRHHPTFEIPPQMNHSSSTTSSIRKVVTTVLCLSVGLLAAQTASAGDTPALLDDFSNAEATSHGTPRFVVDDSSAGGGSRLDQRFEDGVLIATGEIVPARGQPGFVSMAILLNPDGSAADLSKYEGLRLKVRVSQGLLSVSANSAEVDNFDYHAATIEAKPGQEFREIHLPFKEMKRAWSAQTELNRATITGLSVVAVGFQKGNFAYAIDEIGFY